MPFVDSDRGVKEIALVPLTREAIEEKSRRQIWGWIVPYWEEKGGPLVGLCLFPRRHDEYFTHPTLFSEFPVDKKTGPNVEIVLNEDGKLYMYRCYDARWYRYSNWERVADPAPVPTADASKT
ncbi:MAG: hypothetical protein Q7S16_01320 [bacterium]|nr:hypothetical protein [bacterium]